MTEYKISGSFIEAIVNDKAIKWIAGGTLVVALGFSISFSWISGLIIIVSHVIGFLLCYLFRNQIYQLGFFLSAPKPDVPIVTPRSHHCSVCGNNQCARHKPVARGSHKTSLPEQVDQALQLLLDQILEQYIERWHTKVTEDPDFEQELRFSMQNAVSVLLHRINQVDETLVVTERLLPAAIAHFDVLLRAKPLQAQSPDVQEDIWHTAPEVQGNCVTPTQEDISKQWSLGDAPESLLSWHPATFSRRHEIAYLRHLTLKLLPSVLLPHQIGCKAWSGLVREILARWVLLPAMDLLADGAVLIKLLDRLLSHSSLLPPYSAPTQSVPTLQNFVLSHAVPSASRLRVGLSSVLKEPQLLYHFMQFLKKAGAVHVLQFCLDLEKFNDRMLEPDLSDVTLSELYQEAWDLFSLYFSPNSPDCVNFPAEVVHDMKSVLEGGEKNVLKLRNTPPLFQAFEFAYAMLERDLLPQFHHSNDYFIMLCGGRLGTYKKKRSPRPRGEEGSGSGNWARITESAAYAEVRNDVLDSGDSPRGMPSHKNLSAWRVSVPRVYLRPDMPGSTRITAVMVIAVQRIDIQEDDDPAECGWTVYRTYADFCALASKLQEFHGEFDQVECNPLKRPLTRDLEALEIWRGEGEEYLQALLHTPALQNSDLLCAFLSPDIDFAEIAGGSDLSLAKVLRTVRLRKENGQHLEPFISNLIAATKRKPRNQKPREEKDESPPKPVEPVKRLDLKHAVFGDNLGIKHVNCEKILKQNEIQVPASIKSWPLSGLFDSIVYLVVRMFGASKVLVQISLAVRHLFRGVIDSFYQRKLSDKLHRAVGPNRLVFLINLLRDELASQRGSSSRLSFELEVQTAQQVLHHLERLLPWPLARLPHTHSALSAMLRALRTPLLNKQLAYILLDIIVEELYPELSSANNDK